jgi:hypothetical protein
MAKGRIIERAFDGFTFRHYESKSGKRYTHYECERQLRTAKGAMERWFVRTLNTHTTQDTTKGGAELDRDELRQIADDLTAFAAAVQCEIDRLEGADRRAERARALRSVEGRTPEETALYLAKADELEGVG